jgi:hypothetical protein
MKSFPPELIYILIFGAILIVKFLMERAARLRQAGLPPLEPPEDEIPEAEWNAAQMAAVPSPQPALGLVHRRRDGAAAAPPPARTRLRLARQSLFGARWDMQEAIVVATILGRCRADEPHDIR